MDRVWVCISQNNNTTSITLCTHKILYIYSEYTCRMNGMCMVNDDGGGGLHIIRSRRMRNSFFFSFPFIYVLKWKYAICVYDTTHPLSVCTCMCTLFFFISRPKWRQPRVRVKYFIHSSNHTFHSVCSQKAESNFYKNMTICCCHFLGALYMCVCGWFDSHLLLLKDNIREKKRKNTTITDWNGNHCA